MKEVLEYIMNKNGTIFSDVCLGICLEKGCPLLSSYKIVIWYYYH